MLELVISVKALLVRDRQFRIVRPG